MDADTTVITRPLVDVLTELADEMETRPDFLGTMPGVRLQEGRRWASRLRTALAGATAPPALPFTLRVPTNRADGNDGRDLNVGADHVDVQVILDPEMELRGEHRPAYGGSVIALREWDEQVFLHELLHVATGWTQPSLFTTHPPNGHDVIARIEVALWETGWHWVGSS